MSTESELSKNEISADQLALAEKLELELPTDVDLTDLVRKIEAELGQNTMREQARYFILSVYNHAARLKWSSLNDSSLSLEQQTSLASDFIHSDECKQSLRTVLKENRFKFTFLKFAKSRNVEQRVLSTTTKAYKQAKAILVGKGLVQPRRSSVAASKKKESDSGSLVDRRAARRGYFDESEPAGYDDQIAELAAASGLEGLSDEEFDALDAKLSSVDATAVESWDSQAVEDRLSLLVGLVAGCVVFAAIIWFFI